MSTEQDKDTFSIKRNRGGDGGLEGLEEPGLLLGSPEKKKRKSVTQAPSFAALSEYAPPTNPSADHLVACNPFDDDYNSPPASLKLLSNTNHYFAPAQYPGFGGYGQPRVAPHAPNRMPAPYGSQFQLRNQQHLFTQNPMSPMGVGFARTAGFNYRPPENLAFSGQPMFNSNGGMRLSPVPPFRENVNQRPASIVTHNHGLDPRLSLEACLGMIRPVMGKPSPDNTRPGQALPSGLFGQSTTLNLELNESGSKSAAPIRKQTPGEGGAQEAPRKTKNKTNDADRINGVLHGNAEPLKKPAESSAEKPRRPSAHKANSSRNRLGGSAPSVPIYPCGICEVEVNDDQEAILCEASCQKWFHRLCTGMTETAYNLLTAESAAVWGCDACMKGMDVSQLVKTRETPGPTTANGEGQT